MEKSKKGFTLTELLVVIAVIGILAGFVFVYLVNTRASVRDAKRITEIETLRTAVEFYHNYYGEYPRRTDDWIKVEEDDGEDGFANELSFYLPVVPQDPLYKPGGEYSYQYKSTTSDSFIICAKSEAEDGSFCISSGQRHVALSDLSGENGQPEFDGEVEITNLSYSGTCSNMLPGDTCTVSADINYTGTVDANVTVDAYLVNENPPGCFFVSDGAWNSTPLGGTALATSPSASFNMFMDISLPLDAGSECQGATTGFEIVASAVEA